MKFKEFNEMRKKRYTPKEVLAHLIVGAKYIENKSTINELQSSLENIFVQNFNNNKILSNVDSEYLKEIINYWSLTLDQALCYGYIVFYNLSFENKRITPDEITKMFIYVMRIYSPDNAQEFVSSQ